MAVSKPADLLIILGKREDLLDPRQSAQLGLVFAVLVHEND